MVSGQSVISGENVLRIIAIWLVHGCERAINHEGVKIHVYSMGGIF